VVQRVLKASVRVAGEDPPADGRAIGQGLLALVGVTHTDTPDHARRLADKLWHVRIMADADGVMNRSIAEGDGQILVVSQFTLYANTERGRRPGWIAAAPPDVAEPLVEAVVNHLRTLGATVATGRFRAAMEVELLNDGPVTLVIDV
jgi:D-aminoacyl-tRNA deacylase